MKVWENLEIVGATRERGVNRNVIREGRVAYRLGWPATHPAGQFRDPDMAIDWANGWRWEREEHLKRSPPCDCAGCTACRRAGA